MPTYLALIPASRADDAFTTNRYSPSPIRPILILLHALVYIQALKVVGSTRLCEETPFEMQSPP